MAKQTVPQVRAEWNPETKVMEFFYEGRKIGEAPVWEAIMRRRELQDEIDAQAPKVEAPTPLYFKENGDPVYKRPRQRRAA